MARRASGDIGEPPSGEPASEFEAALADIRDESDERLSQSRGMQKVLGSLMELNFEGLERLERRMKSLENQLESRREAGGG